MKNLFRNRRAGGYVLTVSVLLQLVAAINYLTWAGKLSSIDPMIIGGLCLGCAAGVGAFLLNSDLLLVADTALCSYGMLQLATASAGSFADFYQGIVMFGDPSQVPTILTICAMAMLAIVLLIVSGFMGFGKKNA